MDLSRKLSARTILGTGRKETRLGTIPVLFNQDVVRMKFVRSIKTAINTINIPVIKITTEMLRKYLVEYQTINNCGMVNQNNVKLSHRKYIS